MDLHISDFQIIQTIDRSLIISEKGVTLIHSHPFLEALQNIRESNTTHLVQADIFTLFEKHGLVAEDAFAFLEQVVTIRKATTIPYFTQIIIAHDWSPALEEILTSELNNNFQAHPVNEHLLGKITDPHSLIMILARHYNHVQMKSLYFKIANAYPQSAICVALRTGDYFYVSQPFLSEVGGPCHFCNFDKTAYTERVRPTSGHWSSLLNFCIDNTLAIPQQPLTRLQEALATGLIIEKIKFWTLSGYAQRSQDRIMLASYMNLHNGQITEEHVNHWSMCDCLRSLK